MISSTATYALRAIVYLAGRFEEYCTRISISNATLVPHEYLLKVLHQLDVAGARRVATGTGVAAIGFAGLPAK